MNYSLARASAVAQSSSGWGPIAGMAACRRRASRSMLSAITRVTVSLVTPPTPSIPMSWSVTIERLA